MAPSSPICPRGSPAVESIVKYRGAIRPKNVELVREIKVLERRSVSFLSRHPNTVNMSE